MAFSQSQNVASACGPLKRPRDGPWKLEALGPQPTGKSYSPAKKCVVVFKNVIEI